MIRDDEIDGGAMAGSDLPQMEVGDAVALGLDAVADDSFDFLSGLTSSSTAPEARSNP